MKFFSLVTLSLTALLSAVSASYYKASRMTYYGGPGDEYSTKDPFCQDYSSNVPRDVSGISYYVAISADVLSKSNAKDFCGKKIKLSNAENGRSLTALVVDKCRSCGYGNVDLSVKAFKYLSADHMSVGVLKQVSWCIVDGPSKFACPSSSSSSSSSNSSSKNNTKKTTTTKKSSSSSSSSSSKANAKAGGVYVELEKGTRYGYASVEKKIKYYSGNGYVKFTKPYHNKSNTAVQAYVKMKYEGKYNIIVKYNNPNHGTVTNRIVVNNNVYKINFGKTGSEWKKMSIKAVPFKKGTNFVEVKATDGYMSFDYVYIE